MEHDYLPTQYLELNRGRFHGANTPTEMERDHRRGKLWLDLFGSEPPEWENDANAPPIDETAKRALRALFRRELSRDEARRIDDLKWRFRSWMDAYLDISAQEIRKGHN